MNPDDRGDDSSLAHALENADDQTFLEAASDALQAHGRPGVSGADPEIAAAALQMVEDIHSQQAEEVAVRFVSSEPRWVSDDDGDNLQVLLKYMVDRFLPGAIRADGDNNGDVISLLHEKGFWTVEALASCFEEIYPNFPHLPEGQARPLKETEVRTIQAWSSGGQVAEAIIFGLRRMFPQIDRGLRDGTCDEMEVLTNPAYADAVLQITLLAWESSPMAIQAGYTPTQERREKIVAWLAGRTPNVGAIHQAWLAVRQAEQAADRPSRLETISERARQRNRTGGPGAEEVAEMSLEEIDRMTDDEVSAALTNVQTARAEEFRKARKKLL